MYINRNLLIFLEALFMINILLFLFSYFSIKKFKKRKKEIREMSFLVEKQKDDAEKSFNLEKVKFNKQCEDERRKINLEREEMHNYIKEEKNKLYIMRMDFIKELEEKEITASAGGGAVSVTVSGKKEVTKVHIDPEAVDTDDIEMLEDMIMAATNEALRQIDELSQESMAKITGGLGGLGGGFPF